ncbi:hypothetical protein E2320_010266 [Naja naja]|nr:hypothetical protein E2320_010266 [Naja naja]
MDLGKNQLKNLHNYPPWQRSNRKALIWIRRMWDPKSQTITMDLRDHRETWKEEKENTDIKFKQDSG